MTAPAYDTSLSRSQRQLLRAAIAAQLAPLLKANGGYLRAIKSLPRPLKSESEDELGWLGLVMGGQAPCIGIALGRKDISAAGMDIPPRAFLGRIEVAIYVCSSSARNYVDGRLETDVAAAADATADPGCDAMLEHVEELLAGASFLLGGVNQTHEMRPEFEDEVVTAGDLTVWEQRYRLDVERVNNPDRGITTLLTEIQGLADIEGADPANPLVTTVATLEAP